MSQGDTQFSAFARKVLADLPIPNNAGPNNFQSLPGRKDFNDKGDLKIDSTLNQHTTVFARASQRKENDLVPGAIPGPSGGSSNGHVRSLNQQFDAGSNLYVRHLAVAGSAVGYFPHQGR